MDFILQTKHAKTLVTFQVPIQTNNTPVSFQQKDSTRKMRGPVCFFFRPVVRRDLFYLNDVNLTRVIRVIWGTDVVPFQLNLEMIN